MIPGPGSYEKINEYKKIGSGVTFTIPKSKNETMKKYVKTPCPWSYKVIDNLRKIFKSGIIGSSERELNPVN